MTRIFLLVSLVFISIAGKGQCPTLSLASTSGIACGTTTVTVNGNTFGGSATRVSISDNGGGTVNPLLAISSPFSFSYTPVAEDFGKTITITVVSDNPLPSCLPAQATYSLLVEAPPAAPAVGTITQPTCSVATGSVVLNGLPSSGTWTLTRSPGNVITSGTGTSTTISNLSAGTYTFVVISANQCLSPSSQNVVINAQQIPAAPVQTVDCSLGFGKAVVTVTSPTGSGLEYRLDNGTFQQTATFSNVGEGNHTVSVRNSAGCITTGSSFRIECGCVNGPSLQLSSRSGNTCGTSPVTVSGNTFGGNATGVTITENGAGSVTPASSSSHTFSFTYTPAAGDIGNKVTITVTTDNPLGPPCAAASATYELSVNAVPSAPQPGSIVQPTCTVTSGSVTLNGLPSGAWTITRSPGSVTTTGSGASSTVTGLSPGSYTFTVTNAANCTSDASSSVTITSQPPSPNAPVVGTITQPSCSTPSSVVLNGLPISGTWSLTRSPGSVITSGSGGSTTISGLSEGSYTFTVSNSFGCLSASSASVTISGVPSLPTAPVAGTITPPTCTVATGSVAFSGLPASGSWTLTRSPGGITTTGSGSTTTVSGIPSGSYTYTVTNSLGCISPSTNVEIPVQPAVPTPPLIGLITQPRYDTPTGSVVVNGLPTGAWTLTMNPGNISITGTGSSRTVTNIPAGIFSFTVTNSVGCVSLPSASFEIGSVSGPPVVNISNPPAACYPATVDITTAAITAGSTSNLVFTYWTDAAATKPYNTPGASQTGTYYIKGTTSDGFFSIKPVKVSVYRPPVANAGPDQSLPNVFQTQMNAVLQFDYEKGKWSVVSGTGIFSDSTNAKSQVSSLSVGKNKFRWTVTNNACPSVSDSVFVNVGDVAVQTLITPNMDGKNDYLILKKNNAVDKIEIIIFDRRGVEVYNNTDYDNSWNGVDQKGKPLPEDTYFYVVRSDSGTSLSGYILIRR
jgi:gliding motility-associated-like protein